MVDSGLLGGPRQRAREVGVRPDYVIEIRPTDHPAQETGAPSVGGPVGDEVRPEPPQVHGQAPGSDPSDHSRGLGRPAIVRWSAIHRASAGRWSGRGSAWPEVGYANSIPKPAQVSRSRYVNFKRICWRFQKPVIWIQEQAACERCASGTRAEGRGNEAAPVFTTSGSRPLKRSSKNGRTERRNHGRNAFL